MGCCVSSDNKIGEEVENYYVNDEPLESTEILIIRQTWQTLEHEITAIGKALFLR
jgi:hypothetical protein